MLHDSALPSACACAKVSSSPYLFIVSQVMFFPIASLQTAERERGARFRVPGFRRAFWIPQWSKRMVNRRGTPPTARAPLPSLRIPIFLITLHGNLPLEELRGEKKGKRKVELTERRKNALILDSLPPPHSFGQRHKMHGRQTTLTSQTARKPNRAKAQPRASPVHWAGLHHRADDQDCRRGKCQPALATPPGMGRTKANTVMVR